MKARINLYILELRPKKEFLTLSNIVIVWLCCSVIVASYAIAISLLSQNSAQVLAAKRAEFKLNEKKLASLTLQLQKKQDKSEKLSALAKVEKVIQQKQQLIIFIKNKQQHAGIEYGQVMTDLAQTYNAKISLHQFTFNGDNILLQGTASTAQAVPTWLGQLKQSQYFTGKAFSTLELTTIDNDLTFKVASNATGDK